MSENADLRSLLRMLTRQTVTTYPEARRRVVWVLAEVEADNGGRGRAARATERGCSPVVRNADPEAA
jgi:hypothetical protein